MTAAVLAVVAMLALAVEAQAGFQPGPALARSNFTNGLGGWDVVGDPAPGYPQHVAIDGGIARTVDGEEGKTMYWKAPRKYLGDKRAALRGTLQFRNRQSALDNQYEDEDVIFKGAGRRLIIDLAGGPATGGYAGWTLELRPPRFEKPNGGDVSARLLKRVLSDLDKLKIRAEYRTGPDTDDIDAIRLSKPPEA